MEKSTDDIMKEIKQIDNNVSTVLIPILKDSIADYKKIIFDLIVVIILLIFGIIGISGYSIYKYNNFLSQFEYESQDTVYQDLQSSEESNLIVNSGIDVSK